MSSPKVAAATVLALFATACAAPMAPGPTPAAPTPAPPPRPTPSYDWISHVGPEEASLVYGLAESDDVPLMMTCRRQSGRVLLSRPADAPRSLLALSAGQSILSVPVHAEPSQLHDGVFLTGEAAAAEPVLQTFRRGGWISVHENGRWHGFAAQPGSEDAIRQFFSACG